MRAAAVLTIALALSGCAFGEDVIAALERADGRPGQPPQADEIFLMETPDSGDQGIVVAKASKPEADLAAPLDDALTCLARTVYWEAKGEGPRGMNAVAHVVLNRVAHPQYPDDVCGVIKQGGRVAPCQFSWYCDTRPNKAREPKAYARAHEIAWRALNGQTDDPTSGANMFHNPTVKPSWTTKAKRTAVIGNHIFYRLN